ncbi:MAG: MerC domain-containing protein [Betaproteobacteria bacterium]|nr:MerC domain-containing protein [Betaproteobacteria bacterium]
MKELVKQCTCSGAAGFAGACCLGVTGALSIMSAVGAGFLINDAFLIPLYVGLLALSVWLLHGTARSHGELTPFWIGLGGALGAFAGLWIHPALVYSGLAALIGSSVWDHLRGRRAPEAPR